MKLYYSVDMPKRIGSFSYDYAGVVATDGNRWHTEYFSKFSEREEDMKEVIRSKEPTKESLAYLIETQSPYTAMMGPLITTDQYTDLRQCCDAVLEGLAEGE